MDFPRSSYSHGDGGPPRPVPVTLVTGFLGSGKTTLINAVLRNPDFAGAMVIVNEFGEVGLDHLLVSSAQDQVLLLDSGCLCCALSGTLRDTLIDLIARRASRAVPAFDRVLVETSGLANPGPLVATVLSDSAIAPRFTLSHVVTLVDGMHGSDTLRRYHEARRQVAFADLLVVTKTDRVEPRQVRRLETELLALNPHAALTQWDRGSTPASLLATLSRGEAAKRNTGLALRGPLRPQYGQSRDEVVHDAEFARIVTRVLRGAAPVQWPDYAAATQVLTHIYGRELLRCKGILAIGPQRTSHVVQAVQGEFLTPEPLSALSGDLSPHDDGGYLVCIGEGLERTGLERAAAYLKATVD